MIDYKIYLNNNDGNGDLLLYQAGDADLSLADVHWKPSIGDAGSLEFTIRPTHPYFNQIKPLTTDFWVYRNDEPVFRGRYVGAEEDFLRSGHLTCEGDLNFLLDSLQDPHEYTGTIVNYVTRIITAHNSMVEARKRFTIGQLDIVSSGNKTISFDSYTTTMECLREITDNWGGYFRTRHVNGTNYIDLVIDYGGTNNQTIKFGENLIDISKSIDASSIITCLIPLGGDVDVQTSTGTETKPVDISSVNGGLKYITNSAAVAKYGQIWGTKTFGFITDPSILLTAGRTYLNNQIGLPETITLTAADLSIIDENFDEFNVGFWTRVESVPHGVSGNYMLNEADINITDPTESTITLGGKQISFTGALARETAEVNRALLELAESSIDLINTRVNNATNLITGGLGGYVMIHRASDGHPDEILIMNTADIKTAKNVIRFNKNGIGFSTTGYNGTFKNAWTIDGNLVADFITTGQMAADRVKGGTLEIGGTSFARNGSIIVKDASGNLKAVINKDGVQVFNGSISGGAISGASLNANNITGGTINGSVINAGNIRGSVSIQCGDQFYVNASDASQDAEFILGDFHIGKQDRGSTADMYCLMGSDGENLGIWSDGVMWGNDIYLNGDDWWDGWSVTQAIRALWDCVKAGSRHPENYDPY